MPRRPGPRTPRRSALPCLAPAPSGGPRFRVAPAPRGGPCSRAARLHRTVSGAELGSGRWCPAGAATTRAVRRPYGCPRCPRHAARTPAPRGGPRSRASPTSRVAQRDGSALPRRRALRGPSVPPRLGLPAPPPRAVVRALAPWPRPAWSSVLQRLGPRTARSSASPPVPRVLSRGVTDAVAARALRWPARWDRSRSPSCVRPPDHGGRVPTARRCRVIRVGL